MPRISVVVPVYDVEAYVAACLQSLARQSERDLEVIMVDDGSTDGEPRDRRARSPSATARFRVVAQPNGGLGQRAQHGRRARRRRVPRVRRRRRRRRPTTRTARLLGSLDRTGSDLATGNVQRLTRQGTSQAQFLARTFARTAQRTHVSRLRPLLADRTAWNKLYRRSFWDAHGFRFPEGVVHEDIPVTLPAHLAAAASTCSPRRSTSGGCARTARARSPSGGSSTRVLRDRLDAIDERHASTSASTARPTLSHWYAAQPRRRRPAAAPRPARRGRRRPTARCSSRASTRCSTARRRGSSRALPGDRPASSGGSCGSAWATSWSRCCGPRRRAPRAAPVRRARPLPRRRTAAPRERARVGLPARPPRRGPRADRRARRAPRTPTAPLRLLGHAYINALGAAEPAAQELAIVALPPGGLRARAAAARRAAAADGADAPRRPRPGARRGRGSRRGSTRAALSRRGRWDVLRGGARGRPAAPPRALRARLAGADRRGRPRRRRTARRSGCW